jgi:hypothetical protein
MRSLKHVPIGEDVEVLDKQCVVRVDKYMPRMTRRDFGEEVVTVAEKNFR